MSVITLILLYLFIINLLGFIMMFADKEKSKKRAFRIPESTLFTIAVIGGSLGCLLGMYTFRHKTRHMSFVYGMPAILILQIIFSLVLFLSPLEIDFL